MRAVALTNFDEPTTIIEVPTPEPGPGQVRVRVRAAALNRFDTAVAAGMVRDMMNYDFPVVLGRDFAGTIDKVGEGVTHQVGDEVFGYVPPFPALHDGA